MKLSKIVRLQPNTYQEQMFRQFAGTNRFAWNQSKAFRDKVWNDNKEYASVQDMIKHLQDLKHNSSDYAWLNTIPEAITKQAIKDLQKAYWKTRKTAAVSTSRKRTTADMKPSSRRSLTSAWA